MYVYIFMYCELVNINNDLIEITGTRVHFVIFVIFIKIKYFPF